MPSARACLAVIIFTAALCGSAQAQATSTSKTTDKDEDQIAQLERDWLAADARGDAASLGKIVADDFIGSTFNGHLLSKQDIIPQGGGPGGFARATPSESSVRIFGLNWHLLTPENSASSSSTISRCR
jgi:hypothetical protein